MGKQQSKRDQQCMLMSGKINRSLQDQINKKKTGFNLTNYNLHTSVSEFSICCFDSSNKAIEIPLKVELPPQPLPSQKMPDGNTNSHSVLLNSQVLNCAETFSKSTNSAGDTNDDNCNKIEPFECELQVDTSSEKKQDWSFTLYDFDGRGKITKEELASLFQALYDAVGSSIRLPLNGTKKLKLRLSIGHDRSHLDRNPKDQSPPLVKKKAKLKNSSRLVEWKGVSLQPVDTGAHQALVEPSKECPKLNNLDGSPRAKASTVTKLENQLSPTTPGIGHRLTLSCKEQEKLTEMVHENMVRNQVRQQTGRKNHHSAHRHHHHREARRHRVPRRQGDENRKPRERERTYYLDLGSIGHTGCQNPVAPGTTATATVTTSVMTFTRAPLIDVAPSSSSPPPPPPPTASGSTAHCNEIGMVAEDDDGEVVPETGPPGSRLKYGNNKSNIGANNPGTWGKSRQGEGVNLMAPTTAPGTADQPDPHHCRRQHHPHHNHHHHHNHRRRSHPLRGSGDVGHTRCKHCNEQCSPVSFDVVKSGINGSQTVNKDQKREFAHRRYKNNNSNHNNKINHNNNNDNNNNNNNDNNNNNNNNNLKDVTNQTTTVHELSPASEGGDPSKQGPSHPPFKCQIAEGNLKSGADCECSRYQKALCRQRVSNTGSLNIKSDNQPMPRHRNTEGQELTTRMNINPQINTGSVGVAAAPPAPQAVAVTISHPPVEKKSSERLLKQSVTERHKKHNEGHQFSQAGRITTQECGGQTVPTPGLKILTPRGTIGAVAERKTLRTHHKAECSSHCVSSRHKPHWPANTTVPDKPMSNTQLALLPTQTSPAPPALNPTANGGPSNADAAAPASTASDTITNTITNNNNNNNNDNNNKDNSASTLTLQEPQHHHHHHHHLRRRNQSVRNIEFSEAMQQVADWINREHNVPQKEHAQPNAVPRASADAENFVHVQRHEHHHVHEYHHHHHYHHYYQA